jgi:hypothetical protein
MTNADGFTLPATIRPGFTTFRVGSPENSYHAFQGFTLKAGATLDDVVSDLTDGLSGDRARQASGARDLLVHATLIGGVVTSPLAPIEVTVLLKPNTTYYFFDLNDINLRITPRVHTLQTVGFVRLSVPPAFQSVIVTTEHDSEDATHPMIIASRSVRADGTFLAVNIGNEIHEAVWRMTQPGIDDAYISAFYTSVLEGTPRPPSPWADSQHGLQAFSPGEWAIVHIDLLPGNYGLICFVPSVDTGIAHGWTGMHVVQTLS